jgi:hypothetical protein
MHKLAKDGLLKDMFRKPGGTAADDTDRKYTQYLPSEDEDVGGFDPSAVDEFAHWSDEEAESSSSYAWNDDEDGDQTSIATSLISGESSSHVEGPEALFGSRKKRKKVEQTDQNIYNGAQLLCPDDSFSDCAFVFAK